ncbi:hypothetical protein EZV62_007531 [Acer yangbiense]|uniref:Ricin B lectin domain-containing protein n=1 Tax=Acer yangbiense TaxID=1000413 RepID=A0A5C7ICU1_9ROSI|nr:hypothetical protein EZV62_007531 [Acer yangbiense]
MEYPHGHHSHSSHHSHQRNDQDDEERPPHYPPPLGGAPPPPFSQRPSYHRQNEFDAPPPPFAQQPPSYYRQDEVDAPPPPQRPYHHQIEFSAPPPPQPQYYQETEYAPPPPHVTHVHHGSDQPEFNYRPPPPQVSHEEEVSHHSFKPHLPSVMHHHSSSVSYLSNKPTVKVCCKAEPNFSLTIRENKVVLARSDPSDHFQHWYKDEKFSTRVKDAVGFPSFALVNKATGLAIKHSIGETHPVQLISYNPDILDESVLWTESKDTGEGYRAIRMVNNTSLNMDAFNGNKKHGGVHDGTTVVLWKWGNGENQRWKIVPYFSYRLMIRKPENVTARAEQSLCKLVSSDQAKADYVNKSKALWKSVVELAYEEGSTQNFVK